MLMAGLYETWENAEGERLYSYTILTTQSSGSLKWLHNRMPVRPRTHVGGFGVVWGSLVDTLVPGRYRSF